MTGPKEAMERMNEFHAALLSRRTQIARALSRGSA